MTLATDAALGIIVEARAENGPGASGLMAGGLPVIVRQARLLRDAGASRVAATSDQGRAILRRWFADPAFSLTPDEAVTAARAEGRCVAILDVGRVVDGRLLEELVGSDTETMLVESGGAVAAVLARPEHLAEAPAWRWEDVEAVAAKLSRAGAGALAPSSIDAYVKSARRDVPVRIDHVRRASDVPGFERRLIADNHKGVLDWPARYVHPPFEDALVRLIWPTRITPNQISGLTLALGLIGALAFWFGGFGWALAVALVCGVLDGVDGLLARTKLQITPIGDLEHAADKVVEYAWYVGLGAGLARTGGPSWAPWLGVAASILMMLDVWVGASAQRLLGRQLEDTGAFERAFRLIGGRRDTHVFMLLAFGLFGAWFAGLVAVVVSAGLTVLIRGWRLALRVREASARPAQAPEGRALREAAR